MSLLLILFIFKSLCSKGGGGGVTNTHTKKSVHRFYSTARENVKFNFLIAICNMFYFYKERKKNSINIITHRQREQQRQHGEPTASAAASAAAAAAHTSFHSFRTSAASCLSQCVRACVCVCCLFPPSASASGYKLIFFTLFHSRCRCFASTLNAHFILPMQARRHFNCLRQGYNSHYFCLH